MLPGDSFLPVTTMDSVSHGLLNASEAQARRELSLTASELEFDAFAKLSLPPVEAADGETNLQGSYQAGDVQRRKMILLENPNNTIARWATDNIDLEAMVKDALNTGRLPLAVLQLHLLRQKELAFARDPHDTFSEIREIGRSIAYDLFLKVHVVFHQWKLIPIFC